MPENSQEQTIYRSLAGRIQLGFFDDGERFPSVQEVARRFHVSYCPAQRALKALEADGLIRLCRGKETLVLGKPYGSYLKSPVFRARAEALEALARSLELLSASLGLEGLSRLDPAALPEAPPQDAGRARYVKYLYRLFDSALQALGSRTVLSLYYDVDSFAGSAFLDALDALYGPEEADGLLHGMARDMRESVLACRSGDQDGARARLRSVGGRYFHALDTYLDRVPLPPPEERESFAWEPRKGRTRYCDVIAIDLVCKINQGVYPVGALLPHGPALADCYHVSPITIRRTLALLGKLGVTQTINGVGIKVVSQGDGSISRKHKDLMLDDNLRDFLEALQFLAMTGEDVLRLTFPHFTPDVRDALRQALALSGQKASMVGVLASCLQALVHCCPLAPLREIYAKITLLLLRGSVLRLSETGGEPVPHWPELSQALLDALGSDDAHGFAAAFRRLSLENFSATRTYLRDIGIPGLEAVAEPRLY